ncbi:hypothetical protein V8E36_001258 [Tilletia maclaganii]
MLVMEVPRLAHRSYEGTTAPSSVYQSSAAGHAILARSSAPQTSLYGHSDHHHHHHGVGRPAPQLDAKVVILGSQGVGKTSMVHRYTVESFNPRATPSTIGAQFSTKKVLCDGVKVRLQLWDTAGQERYKSMMPLYYRGSHAAVIVYDITSRQSFEDVKDWVEELRKNMADDLVIHIVGSKLDLAKNSRAVEFHEARDAIRSWFAPPAPPEPAPRPSTSTSSLLFFPSSSSGNAEGTAQSAVSGLTRAVSTRLAGMRANSFTKSYTYHPNTDGGNGATGSAAAAAGAGSSSSSGCTATRQPALTRSKTAHVAVPGRTMSNGQQAAGAGAGAGGQQPPFIQARGASLDALRNVPFPSASAGPSSHSAAADLGTSTSEFGAAVAAGSAAAAAAAGTSNGGGSSLNSGRGRQVLARMRTNSSINIFPSLLSGSSSNNAAAAAAAGASASSGSSNGGPISPGSKPTTSSSPGAASSSFYSHPNTTTPGSELDLSKPAAVLDEEDQDPGPFVVEGIELSEVSAKDDEGIEYVFAAIARKLVERRMRPAAAGGGGASGLGSGQGGGGHGGSRSTAGGGSDASHGFGGGEGSSHLRARRNTHQTATAAASARQSIILHQPEPDDDDDDDVHHHHQHDEGDGLLLPGSRIMHRHHYHFHGRGSEMDSGIARTQGGSAFATRPASVQLDRRGRDAATSWGSCCAV